MTEIGARMKYKGVKIGEKVLVDLGFTSLAGGLIKGRLREIDDKGITVGKQFVTYAQIKKISAC